MEIRKGGNEIDAAYFDFIRKVEGVKNRIYPDSIGKMTIGVGHLLTSTELSSKTIIIKGQPIDYSNGLTDEQVMSLNKQDTKFAIDCINTSVKVPLTQNQFNALVSFVFNIGVPTFKLSTLLIKLNNSQYDEVPNELGKWVHASGKISQGLVNRRGAEIALWNS
jgi:lysozyme